MGGLWVSASRVAVLIMTIFVQGCGDNSDVSCPEADRIFFDNSIKGHLERNPGEGGLRITSQTVRQFTTVTTTGGLCPSFQTRDK